MHNTADAKLRTPLLFLLLAWLSFACSPTGKKGVSVMDFGAVNDGSALTSEAIQKAIDKVSADGGGQVNVPAGTYLSGTILLKDGVTLFLEKGAEIIGSNSLNDYTNIDPFTDAVGQQRGRCLIGAKGAKNIALKGEGAVNGRGERMVYTKKGQRSMRPFLIRIVDCQNVELDGIETRNSAAWNIHVFQSSKVRLTNLRILSQSEGNGDGIDVDSSNDVYIGGCDINAHDDAICFKSTSPQACRDVKVENCRLSSRWGAIKFGTESMGNFENFEISDCYIYDTHGGGIKVLSVDGSNVSNINIHDIEMNDVDMPIFMRLGARLRTYRNAEKRPVGSMSGVSIKNIKIHGKRWKKWRMEAPGTIFITGIEDAKIKDVSIENVDAVMYFNNKAEKEEVVLPENRERYPEFIFFGKKLPAYGAYIRHASGVTLKNVKLTVRNNDERSFVKVVDVDNLKLDNVQTNLAPAEGVQQYVFKDTACVKGHKPLLSSM
ncbi:exo-poly-alpha-D-galacturonosidase [Fulvitalea axinellae]|uniref:Exo-poly-alpha-D-galacturonosidase n=1 Tax=Fulvitalea axinellae TaxID=1182444 RepID=A0AAU9CIC5_9BACT|nr:exo-poly-alpha-D-galacturonosidase [Fulvitalea axinellae]